MKINIALLIFMLGLVWSRDSKGESTVNSIGKSLPPDILPAKAIHLSKEVGSIYEVPVDNAVATNGLSNAVTLIKFEQEHAKLQQVRKNFVEDLWSDYDIHLPCFDDNLIAVLQNRIILFFNLTTRSFREFWIPNDLSESFIKAFAVDWNGTKILFDIEGDAWVRNRDGYAHSLRLIEFSQSEWGYMAEKTPGIGIDDPKHKENWNLLDSITTGDKDWSDWQLIGKTIISYQNKERTVEKGKLLTLPEKATLSSWDIISNKFVKSNHPLVIWYNSTGAKTIGEISKLLIHPTLPFALLVEHNSPTFPNTYDDIVWLVRWEHPDEKKRLIPLFCPLSSFSPGLHPKKIGKLEFSPDGKWLMIHDASEKGKETTPTYIAVSIDSKSDMYLGKSYILGSVQGESIEAASHCWIRKPQTSFVAVNGNVIYKWDLGSVGEAKK